MKYEMFGSTAWRFAVVTSCIFAAVGCGAGAFEDEGDASPSSAIDETAGAEALASHAEALTPAPSACAQYEAENIGRTGGSPAAQGWKLAAAGDNLNVNRQFVAGAHAFSIFARGVSGGGVKPQLKLTLNGIQIGGNITVTNTAITDGWKEFVVNYDVTTGNNKLIKVELANPGSGRSVVIDGINLYCPGTVHP